MDLSEGRYLSGRRRASLLGWGLRARTAIVRSVMRPGASVLDVGAADGAMLAGMREEFELARAVSVEVSLTLAQSIPRDGVCASGTALPFADGVFDLVVCCAARKHVRDSARLAREFLRVLRPGGRALVVDPHPWVLALGLRLGKFDPRWLHHRSTARDLAEELTEAGFVEARTRSGYFVSCVATRPETGA